MLNRHGSNSQRTMVGSANLHADSKTQSRDGGWKAKLLSMFEGDDPIGELLIGCSDFGAAKQVDLASNDVMMHLQHRHLPLHIDGTGCEDGVAIEGSHASTVPAPHGLEAISPVQRSRLESSSTAPLLPLSKVNNLHPLGRTSFRTVFNVVSEVHHATRPTNYRGRCQ